MINSDRIPLIIEKTETNSILPYIDIFIDGHKMRCLFDTGAYTTSIESNPQTLRYKNIGVSESKGTAGIAKQTELILINKFQIGSKEFTNFKIERCDRGIVGLDVFEGKAFEVDYNNRSLNLLETLKDRSNNFTLKILASGHMIVPLTIDGVGVDVLFDTGADTTIIDSKFINEYSHLFELSRSEDGFDAHGNRIPSQIYKTRNLHIGQLKLSDVEMATFDFGDEFRNNLEGTPIILGNNIISKAKWSFDIANKLWDQAEY